MLRLKQAFRHIKNAAWVHIFIFMLLHTTQIAQLWSLTCFVVVHTKQIAIYVVAVSCHIWLGELRGKSSHIHETSASPHMNCM